MLMYECATTAVFSMRLYEEQNPSPNPKAKTKITEKICLV